MEQIQLNKQDICSTGAHCIGVGMEQIQLNKQDVCFCGAGEAEDWGFSVMFDAMGALSTKYNDTPETASRAFDQTRDGFVIAGGGGQRCMQMAMDMANDIGGEKQVDYVNTHGTSTPVGDTMELNGIKTVFTEAGYQPYVGSTKSLSGHALGAAGVHEAIYSLLMLRDGFLAESANIHELVDEAEGMNILTERVDGEVNRVMSNSFGFGGTNACLVFDKYTE